MGMDIEVTVAYGIKVDADPRPSESQSDDPDDWEEAPAGLVEIWGGRGFDGGDDVFWVLPDTKRPLFDLRGAHRGEMTCTLLPDMHDPLAIVMYDEIIADALKAIGVDAMPGAPAWYVITSISS